MRLFRALPKVPRWCRYAWPHVRRALSEPRYGIGVAHAAVALWREGGFEAIERGIATSSPAISDYSAWIRMYDSLTADDRAAIRRRCAQLPDDSFPDVIVVRGRAGATDAIALERTLASLERQVDPRWRALVVDVAPSGDGIPATWSDSRVHLIGPPAADLAGALNAALERVTGAAFAVIRAGDELAAHAIYRFAEELSAYPDTPLAYSDEDSLKRRTRRGPRRADPCFQPDWSPELVMAAGRLRGLVAVRSEIARRLDGYDAAFDDAAELDLILRAASASPATPRHITEVLLHKGKWLAPTSRHSAAAVRLAAARSVEGHLDRSGRRAAVVCSADDFRVLDALPSPPPEVALVMPTRDAGAMVAATVASLLDDTDYPNLSLVLVDNGSTEPTAVDFLRAIANRSGVRVVSAPGPFNFAHLINTGVAAADSDLVALVNNDLRVIDPDWLRELVSLACLAGVGAAGACLRYPDGSLQHGGIVTGLGGVAGHSHKGLPFGHAGHCRVVARRHEVTALTGACLVTRKPLFQSLGGMDALELPVAFNDVDLCLKMGEAGYRLVWSPHAQLEHLESASRGPEDSPDKVARFEREVAVMKARWGGRLERDPYYSPNLTLDREDFSLAWPPRTVRAWHPNWSGN